MLQRDSIRVVPILVRTFGVAVDLDSDPKILFVAYIMWGRERDAGHSFQHRAKIKALRSYTFMFPTCHWHREDVYRNTLS